MGIVTAAVVLAVASGLTLFGCGKSGAGASQ